MNIFNRAICPHCRRCFAGEAEEQKFCCYMCESKWNGIVLSGSVLKTQKCKNCERVFKETYIKTFCSDRCKLDKKNTRLTTEEKNQRANKRWEKGVNNLRKGRKIPFEILERIEERRRVMDENAWTHYCKGRKWDRI